MAYLPVFYWTPEYSFVEDIEASTEVTVFESGVESRRKRRERLIRTFKISFSILEKEVMDAIWDFFIARCGRFGAFLYRDYLNDYKVVGEELSGTKNGSNNSFYTSRPFIIDPADGDFSPPVSDHRLYKNGSLLTEGTDYYLNYATGEFYIITPPIITDTITADYEYYYKVRFDIDTLTKDLFGGTMYKCDMAIKELLSIGLPFYLGGLGWDPTDTHSSIILTNFNLTTTGTSPGGSGTHGKSKCVMARDSGKWYWEYKYEQSSYMKLDYFGISNGGASLSSALNGSGEYSIRASSGAVACNGSVLFYFSSIDVGDVVMVAVDLDVGRIWFGKNGTWLGAGNPGDAVSECSGITGSIMPAISHFSKDSSNIGKATVSLFSGSFVYPPPFGFSAYAGGAGG